MLARPSGPQIDENRCEITSTGVCVRGRISTGTAPDGVSGAPSSVARGGADAAPASSPSRLIMRPASPCMHAAQRHVLHRLELVADRRSRTAAGCSAIATTCETIMPASPPTSSVSTTTAPSTAAHLRAHEAPQLAHQRRDQQAQDHGQRDRHQHLAPEIEQPSTTAPLTRPPAWNFVGEDGRSGRCGWRRRHGRLSGQGRRIRPSLAPKACPPSFDGSSRQHEAGRRDPLGRLRGARELVARAHRNCPDGARATAARASCRGRPPARRRGGVRRRCPCRCPSARWWRPARPARAAPRRRRAPPRR